MITSVSELKLMVLQGWELWYIAMDRSPLPGRWELRQRNRTVQVGWDAIVRARKNLQWWKENTEEQEMCGGDWMYRAKQGAMTI